MPLAPPAMRLSIRLLGSPDFRVNGEPLPRLKTRKGLYVLALLALRGGREVERRWLAGTLWPENEEATALTYLRQALTDLRHALGEVADLLQSPTSRTLRLDIDRADVDAAAFTQFLKRGDIPSLEQAVALYRGPLLEGWTEEWLLAERDACQQSYLGALETLAREAVERKDSASAVSCLRRIIGVEPLRESAYRGLMQSLAATRDFAAVTQVYRDLRSTLRREVNAEPDVETQALFARLRVEARRQAADASFSSRAAIPAQAETSAAPERTASRTVVLPHPLSEFIGRTRELDAVKRALAASRLVTLTGIGGVGKTRLAIRAAEEAADDFPDGVQFVDLSPLTDPALVAKTVAAALGVPEQAGRSLSDSLCEYLRERHLLLVLDNCEHLAGECARLVAALLGHCPHIRVLATSRQRLGLTGETVFLVPPLTLPDRSQLRDEDKNVAAALMEYEAVRLFLDRAQRVQPNLYVNQQTLRAVAGICLRLDGIPLALELAAARMSVLGAEQMAERLARHFRLLSSRGGDRTAPARQQTLRGALDWSHDLLTNEERVLLRRLSVFAGGWTLEAAEAVCAGNGLDEVEEWEVLDCLTGLAEHSLVLVETQNGQARYRLLDVVREYARERLGESVEEAAGLRARHREYFQNLARQAASQISGPELGAWLDRLEREHDNLRAALDDCLEEGTPESIRAGLHLAGDLQRFWMQRGYAGEGRRRYDALLSRDPNDPAPERAHALEGAGTLAYRQGDYAAARKALEEALSIRRQTGDRRAEAVSLGLLGNIARVQGDYGNARMLLEDALTLRRAEGQKGAEAFLLNSIANILVEEGGFAEARTLYEQALALSREVGDPTLQASILNGLGRLADFQNDFAGARPWFEQALAIGRELGDHSQIIINTYNLGNNAQALGDMAAAHQYYREALLLTRELGESRSRRLIAFLLKGLAFTALPRGLPDRAAVLLGASDVQREAIGVPLNADDQQEYDRLAAELRTLLGPEAFAAHIQEGRILRMEQAVSLALE